MNNQSHDTSANSTEHDTVGATLRRARKARGMSLQELAAQSGVSVGMISQVERGRANPSMRLLASLRRALNLSFQELFGDAGDATSAVAGDPAFVRRAADRPVIDLGQLQKELLTSGGGNNLQIMLLKIASGGHSGGSALSYPAEKGGLVLAGEVVLEVNGQQAVLHAGDSFTFDSAQPHSIRNNGATTAKVIWIIGAVRFDRHL